MKHVAPDILGKVAPRAVIQPPEPSLGFPRAFHPREIFKHSGESGVFRLGSHAYR